MKLLRYRTISSEHRYLEKQRDVELEGNDKIREINDQIKKEKDLGEALNI